MGSRSKARARAQASQTVGQPASGAQQRGGSSGTRQAQQPQQPQQAQTPRTVLSLAVIEAAETAGILLASILAGIDTASGKSYELASGIAITAIGVGTALALALVARGLWRGRRWTRTPTMLTQLFTGIVGIYLVQGARYTWGIPALVLAVAGVGLLLAPASLRILTPGRAEKPSRS